MAQRWLGGRLLHLRAPASCGCGAPRSNLSGSPGGRRVWLPGHTREAALAVLVLLAGRARGPVNPVAQGGGTRNPRARCWADSAPGTGSARPLHWFPNGHTWLQTHCVLCSLVCSPEVRCDRMGTKLFPTLKDVAERVVLCWVVCATVRRAPWGHSPGVRRLCPVALGGHLDPALPRCSLPGIPGWMEQAPLLGVPQAP